MAPIADLRQMVIQKGWETLPPMFSKHKAKQALFCQSLAIFGPQKVGPCLSVSPSFTHLLCGDHVSLSHHAVMQILPIQTCVHGSKFWIRHDINPMIFSFSQLEQKSLRASQHYGFKIFLKMEILKLSSSIIFADW